MHNASGLRCPALIADYIKAFDFDIISDPDELALHLKRLPNWIEIHNDIISVITNPDKERYKEPQVYYLLSSLLAKPNFPGDYHKLMARYLCTAQMAVKKEDKEAIKKLIEEKRLLVSAIFEIIDEHDTRRTWPQIISEKS